MVVYEPVIGLEVHVQLKTRTKAFCGCTTEFGKEPNSQVCPVCLGFPGSLPVLNRIALEYALKVGIALHCHIQEFTKFDRKNYFYPDLPKNYQISQYDLPIALDGFMGIDINEKSRNVAIRRVHLEEDAGKLIHKDTMSLVDFNRAGMPLLEIVSQPDIYSPEEAYEYLTVLKSVVQYLGVSDCDMEKGTLRCDANVSVRPKGQESLGVKTEVKNLNSFKAVRDALAFEIERQIGVLAAGMSISQETRLWDSKELKTQPMRSKEEAKDYRYFPEPDLPPFLVSKDRIEAIKKTIPELPKEKLKRFIADYGLSAYDAKILIMNKPDADFAEACIKGYSQKDKKMVVNWLIGPLFSEANIRQCGISDLLLTVPDLLSLLAFVDGEQISNLTAKSVLAEMLATKKSAQEIIKEKNLIQISDEGSLKEAIDQVLSQHAQSVLDYKAGKINALMFLVGQVMKHSKGKANPKVVQELLKRRLSDE